MKIIGITAYYLFLWVGIYVSTSLYEKNKLYDQCTENLIEHIKFIQIDANSRRFGHSDICVIVPEYEKCSCVKAGIYK